MNLIYLHAKYHTFMYVEIDYVWWMSDCGNGFGQQY
jgi:hypothetical protein